MPYAVEASGYGGDGGEEGVAHPDGQHGVFLAERLAGGDGVAVVAPYSAAEVELAAAACERYGHEPELGGECYGGMDDASCGHGHGKGEGHGPEVERQVLMAADARAQLRQKVAQEHCGDQRQQQQGEHLAEYQRRGSEGFEVRVGMHQRHHGGNEKRRGEVDEHGVGGDVVDVAAEPTGDYGSRRGRRTDEAYHRPFEHHPQAAVGHYHKHAAYGGEEAALDGEQPPMPAAQAQLPRVDLAEGEEQHGEDEQRLHDGHGAVGRGARGFERGDAGIDEVAENACQYGDYESPVL